MNRLMMYCYTFVGWVFCYIAGAESPSPAARARYGGKVRRARSRAGSGKGAVVDRGSLVVRGASGVHPRISLGGYGSFGGYIEFIGNPGVHPGCSLTTTGLSQVFSVGGVFFTYIETFR